MPQAQAGNLTETCNVKSDEYLRPAVRAILFPLLQTPLLPFLTAWTTIMHLLAIVSPEDDDFN